MVGNPEDKSSHIEAQITSMSQFHFPQIDIFSSNHSCRDVLNFHNMSVTMHSVTDIQVPPVPIQPKTFDSHTVHSTLRSLSREDSV